ncbi:MAG: DNA-directed RNA polymerase [Nanoarchaeota archaeon]
MYYAIEIRDHVRVDPQLFGEDVKEAIIKELKEKYANFINLELGVIITVIDVLEVGEGVIIPGDGAAYYDTTFKLLVFRPELHEVVFGRISEITSFGAFINLGPIDGMIHISQTMDDFVSFSKGNILVGRNSKRNLRKDDLCIARTIAISYKDPKDPKIGLTMRQIGLGKQEWMEQDKRKAKVAEKQAGKEGKEEKGKVGKEKKEVAAKAKKK